MNGTGWSDGAGSAQRVRRFALISLVGAVVVAAIKLLAWLQTGSIAILSDALESVINIVAAFAAMMAIRYAQKPPDAQHPFGHHKAEYFSAVLEGVMIALAAIAILVTAIPALLAPEPLDNSTVGIAITILAAALNGALGLSLLRVGRQERSPALEADGRHVLTDVWTSAGVVVALILVTTTGWRWLDPAIAILVALNILYHGGKVVLTSLNDLMDRSVDAEEQAAIEAIVRSEAAGAIEVHDIRTRIAGPARFVEFHMVVDGAMTVSDSHAICDRVEAGIRDQLPNARVTIHVEPEEKAKQEGVVIEA